MLVFKIYDCKLRKNRTKGAKQWRFNQNTTETMWFNEYPYRPSYKQALYIVDNINKYFPHIKPQKNTRIEFYYK